MNKIINYGSLNIDMVYSVEHFVRAGETIPAKAVNIFPGGKGLNQSIALSRAGAEVYHVGKVGPDGLWLVELMEQSGVNTEFVSKTGSVTGTALIQVSSAGNNCIIINPGANGENTQQEISAALSGFGKGDLLLLQNEVNGLHEAIELAYNKEIAIALNPSPIDELIKCVDLSKITYLLMNEIEGGALSGEVEPEKICRTLLQKYGNLKIVLTLGERGVLYCDARGNLSEEAKLVTAVDTTGAGDTFTGYFLAEMALDGDAAKALKKATTASAIAVSRMGAAKSVPSISDVISFQNQTV